MDRALEALEQRDSELATFVIADDDRIDGRYLEVHQGILSLLALQAPVAGDLRVVAALLHVIKHAERMGDQCVNIAKLIPLVGNEPPVVPELLEKVLRMGAATRAEVIEAKLAFKERELALARDLARQDREVNRLNKEVFHGARRGRRRHRPPRVGDGHDDGRAGARAHRRQRGRRRRAGDLRGDRAVPEVPDRAAPEQRAPTARARRRARARVICVTVGRNCGQSGNLPVKKR